MSGNILSTGYMAGFGMTIGSVWGRIAGQNAARAASDPDPAGSVRAQKPVRAQRSDQWS
jgi:hypothetical protein